MRCLSCPSLSLPPCCIGICSSIFSTPLPGVTTSLGYWIYHGLVPNSKCLFLNGTVCTSLVQLMLLFPRGLCQQTLVLRFTAQNSFAGQVVFNLYFSPWYTWWFSMWQAGPDSASRPGNFSRSCACLQAEPCITSGQLQRMQKRFQKLF